MIGFNGTFLPMHWLGLEGHAAPRRHRTIRKRSRGSGTAFESVCSFLMVASVLLIVVNIVMELAQRQDAPAPNPWGARTLEWMISSPPPYYNFKKIPVVLDMPYDFTQPLPYRDLDEETDPYPVPSEAVLPRRAHRSRRVPDGR